MKINKRKLWRRGICAGVAVTLAAVAFYFFGAHTASSPNVTVGLQHLADGVYVAASGKAGEEIKFDAAFFDNAMQGAQVSAITVTSLPDLTVGELMLGQGEVSVGQRIDRDNLSYLRYIPTDGSKNSDFCFVPQLFIVSVSCWSS